MKGQKMLKVCSILMIIGGAFVTLTGILMIAGLSILLSGLGGAAVAIMTIAVIVGCLGGALELAAGIVGVKAAGMPSVGKIKAALVLGILVIVMALFSNIYTLVTADQITFSSFLSACLGLVIPVLYLVGLVQFKNALVALLSGD